MHGGITAEYMFSPNTGIQTAFLYSKKGSKTYINEKGTLNSNGKIDFTLFLIPKLGYLELPLHLVYKAAIAADSRINFSARPYLAYGLSGAYLIKDKLVFSGEIEQDKRKEIEDEANKLKKS